MLQNIFGPIVETEKICKLSQKCLLGTHMLWCLFRVELLCGREKKRRRDEEDKRVLFDRVGPRSLRRPTFMRLT